MSTKIFDEIMRTANDTDADADEAARACELIRVLRPAVRIKRNGRIETTHGDKTPLGFYRTVKDMTTDRRPAAELKVITGFLRDMCAAFPGLVDGEEDVNGGDLVDWIYSGLTPELRALTAPVWHTEHRMVCRDCFDVVAGNTDTLDTDREGEITAALNALPGPCSVSVGRPDRGVIFSRYACELCESKLGGSRHEIAITREGEK